MFFSLCKNGYLTLLLASAVGLEDQSVHHNAPAIFAKEIVNQNPPRDTCTIEEKDLFFGKGLQLQYEMYWLLFKAFISRFTMIDRIEVEEL